jgi:hypothetical protein
VDFLALEVTTLQALVNLNELVGQVFYVDWAWKYTSSPPGTIPDHIFTLKKNINVLERNSARSDIVTRLFLEVNDFSSPFPWQTKTFTYDNLPAQATFGIIEQSMFNSSLVTNTWLTNPSIDGFAAQFLSEHDEPKNFLRLEINDTIDFTTVKPWDLVRIKNIDFTIADALVDKINYTSTSLSIDCEKTIDFGQEVVNQT